MGAGLPCIAWTPGASLDCDPRCWGIWPFRWTTYFRTQQSQRNEAWRLPEGNLTGRRRCLPWRHCSGRRRYGAELLHQAEVVVVAPVFDDPAVGNAQDDRDG